MDKIDFINWLLYHFDVSDFIFEREIEKYSNGLKENIDFKQLQLHVEKFITYRPTSIELNKIATMHKFFIADEYTHKNPALRHIQYLKQTRMQGTMKDLDDEIKEKIRAFLGKYGKKPSFDM